MENPMERRSLSGGGLSWHSSAPPFENPSVVMCVLGQCDEPEMPYCKATGEPHVAKGVEGESSPQKHILQLREELQRRKEDHAQLEAKAAEQASWAEIVLDRMRQAAECSSRRSRTPLARLPENRPHRTLSPARPKPPEQDFTAQLRAASERRRLTPPTTHPEKTFWDSLKEAITGPGRPAATTGLQYHVTSDLTGESILINKVFYNSFISVWTSLRAGSVPPVTVRELEEHDVAASAPNTPRMAAHTPIQTPRERRGSFASQAQNYSSQATGQPTGAFQSQGQLPSHVQIPGQVPSGPSAVQEVSLPCAVPSQASGENSVGHSVQVPSQVGSGGSGQPRSVQPSSEVLSQPQTRASEPAEPWTSDSAQMSLPNSGQASQPRMSSQPNSVQVLGQPNSGHVVQIPSEAGSGNSGQPNSGQSVRVASQPQSEMLSQPNSVQVLNQPNSGQVASQPGMLSQPNSVLSQPNSGHDVQIPSQVPSGLSVQAVSQPLGVPSQANSGSSVPILSQPNSGHSVLVQTQQCSNAQEPSQHPSYQLSEAQPSMPPSRTISQHSNGQPRAFQPVSQHTSRPVSNVQVSQTQGPRPVSCHSGSLQPASLSQRSSHPVSQRQSVPGQVTYSDTQHDQSVHQRVSQVSLQSQLSEGPLPPAPSLVDEPVLLVPQPSNVSSNVPSSVPSNVPRQVEPADATLSRIREFQPVQQWSIPTHPVLSRLGKERPVPEEPKSEGEPRTPSVRSKVHSDNAPVNDIRENESQVKSEASPTSKLASRVQQLEQALKTQPLSIEDRIAAIESSVKRDKSTDRSVRRKTSSPAPHHSAHSQAQVQVQTQGQSPPEMRQLFERMEILESALEQTKQQYLREVSSLQHRVAEEVGARADLEAEVDFVKKKTRSQLSKLREELRTTQLDKATSEAREENIELRQLMEENKKLRAERREAVQAEVQVSNTLLPVQLQSELQPQPQLHSQPQLQPQSEQPQLQPLQQPAQLQPQLQPQLEQPQPQPQAEQLQPQLQPPPEPQQSVNSMPSQTKSASSQLQISLPPADVLQETRSITELTSAEKLAAEEHEARLRAEAQSKALAELELSRPEQFRLQEVPQRAMPSERPMHAVQQEEAMTQTSRPALSTRPPSEHVSSKLSSAQQSDGPISMPVPYNSVSGTPLSSYEARPMTSGGTAVPLDSQPLSMESEGVIYAPPPPNLPGVAAPTARPLALGGSAGRMPLSPPRPVKQDAQLYMQPQYPQVHFVPQPPVRPSEYPQPQTAPLDLDMPPPLRSLSETPTLPPLPPSPPRPPPEYNLRQAGLALPPGGIEALTAIIDGSHIVPNAQRPPRDSILEPVVGSDQVTRSLMGKVKLLETKMLEMREKAAGTVPLDQRRGISPSRRMDMLQPAQPVSHASVSVRSEPLSQKTASSAQEVQQFASELSNAVRDYASAGSVSVPTAASSALPSTTCSAPVNGTFAVPTSAPNFVMATETRGSNPCASAPINPASGPQSHPASVPQSHPASVPQSHPASAPQSHYATPPTSRVSSRAAAPTPVASRSGAVNPTPSHSSDSALQGPPPSVEPSGSAHVGPALGHGSRQLSVGNLGSGQVPSSGGRPPPSVLWEVHPSVSTEQEGPGTPDSLRTVDLDEGMLAAAQPRLPDVSQIEIVPEAADPTEARLSALAQQVETLLKTVDQQPANPQSQHTANTSQASSRRKFW